MPFSECGPEIPDSVVLPIPKPVTHGNRLSGEVIYLDRFGNLSANIQLDAAPTRKMEISVGGVTICGLSRSFGDVPVGRPLALINSFGLLEIAVNQGNAADLLGVAIGAPVTVASE
jgi:S-adenosylmethionine hydrolase